MSHDLSDACWWDRCEDCRRQWCEHPCHDEQAWDFTAREWVIEDADVDA